MSTELKSMEGGAFLTSLSNAEQLLNSMLALMHPTSYAAGMEALMKLRFDDTVANPHPHTQLWTSPFSGIQAVSLCYIETKVVLLRRMTYY